IPELDSNTGSKQRVRPYFAERYGTIRTRGPYVVRGSEVSPGVAPVQACDDVSSTVAQRVLVLHRQSGAGLRSGGQPVASKIGPEPRRVARARSAGKRSKPCVDRTDRGVQHQLLGGEPGKLSLDASRTNGGGVPDRDRGEVIAEIDKLVELI